MFPSCSQLDGGADSIELKLEVISIEGMGFILNSPNYLFMWAHNRDLGLNDMFPV